MASGALRLAFVHYGVLMATMAPLMVLSCALGGLLLVLPVLAHTPSPQLFDYVGVAVVGLGTALASASGIEAAASAAQGSDSNSTASWRRAFERRSTVLVVALLVTLWVALARIAVVPALFLYIVFAPSVPVAVLEERTPGASILRTWHLVMGRWWATLASFVLVQLMLAVCVLPAYLIANLVFTTSRSQQVATVVAVLLVEAVCLPVQVAWSTLVYLDLRDRRDARWHPPIPPVRPSDFGAAAGESHPGPAWGAPRNPSPGQADRMPDPPAPLPLPPPQEAGGWRVSPKPPEPTPRRISRAPERSEDGPPSKDLGAR